MRELLLKVSCIRICHPVIRHGALISIGLGTFGGVYLSFGANIAVPEGETVGPISVAIALDGNTLLGTEMEITPAAVEEFGNVSRCTPIGIWKGCCQTVSVRNTSAVPIAVENANLGIEQ